MSSMTQTDLIREQSPLLQDIIEYRKPRFAQVLLSKKVKANDITVTRQIVTPVGGIVIPENSTITADNTTKNKRTKVTNELVIVGDRIEVSATAQIINPKAVATEKEAKMLAAMDKIEEISLKGGKSTDRTAKGLLDFVPEANKKTINTVTGLFDGTILSEALENIAEDANLCITGFKAKTIINSLCEQTDVTNTDSCFHGKISTLDIDGAENCAVVRSKYLDTNQALFLNTNRLQLPYLRLLNMSDGRLNNYDGVAWNIISEFCAINLNPNTMVLVTFAEE